MSVMQLSGMVDAEGDKLVECLQCGQVGNQHAYEYEYGYGYGQSAYLLMKTNMEIIGYGYPNIVIGINKCRVCSIKYCT